MEKTELLQRLKLESVWKIATTRAVIPKPLADGVTQEIVTLTFVLTDLIGAAWTLGLAAARLQF
jgi:hypothetical protein